MQNSESGIRPHRWFCLALLFLLSSCATYHQSNQDFHSEFEKGELDDALAVLQEKNEKVAPKERFLYLVNNGLVNSMLGRYEESNRFFEDAYLFGEDYRINYANEAASYLTNPMFTVYRGEDHEHLMVLYYKALNFMKMKRYSEALVECRRLNTRLQQLSDRNPQENKYGRDAFVHMLMGILYEADKDYNNAFIAYRNAYEVYKSDYEPLFGLGPGRQLRQDVVRTAWLTGFDDEYRRYKAEFGLDSTAVSPGSGADLVFLWHNGLVPVKDEWSINFFIEHKKGSLLIYNRELGVSFPYYLRTDYSEQEERSLSSLEVFRVAFPKYVVRLPYYAAASVSGPGGAYPLEVTEDLAKIAVKSLDQRMMREFSRALIRVAVKKSLEYSVRKENAGLGAAIGILNAITEKADTRNWQTLPALIYYARVPLDEGENNLVFAVKGRKGETEEYRFTYTAAKGETLIHTFSSLETLNPYSY